MQTAEIKGLIEQLRDLNERELYAGLAVLASGYKADWIKNIQCEVVPKIKKSFPNSPYLSEESKQACRDMVARVTNTDENVRRKALEELRTVFVTDYYVEPGRLFFEDLGKKLKGVICKGSDSPYERFKNGLLEQPDLPAAIVGEVRAKDDLAIVYIPLLVYFALLVVKIGLKAYCEL